MPKYKNQFPRDTLRILKIGNGGKARQLQCNSKKCLWIGYKSIPNKNLHTNISVQVSTYDFRRDDTKPDTSI